MKILTIITLVFTMLSCHSGKTTSKDNSDTPSPMERKIVFAPGPQTIIYKTKKDYSNLVPVTMDRNKTKIISYPAPSDVYYKGNLAKPTALSNGYLLDNRGINENVAFLNYTYEEYAQLTESPQLADMMAKIADKYPLAELIDCGIRTQYRDEISELNALIDADFPGCKRADIPTAGIQLEIKR